MITTGLLVLLKGLVDFLITIRPAWEVHFPAMTGIVAFWKGYDDLVPITEGLQCLSIYIVGFQAVHGFKWQLKLMDWIADVIP